MSDVIWALIYKGKNGQIAEKIKLSGWFRRMKLKKKKKNEKMLFWEFFLVKKYISKRFFSKKYIYIKNFY